MKNVTITMRDEVARWVRIAAAEREMSVSRFVGEVLREKMAAGAEYDEARRRYFAREATLSSEPGKPYPKREDLYDRPVLLR